MTKPKHRWLDFRKCQRFEVDERLNQQSLKGNDVVWIYALNIEAI